MTASVPKRVFPLESLDSAGGSIYVNLLSGLSSSRLVCHTRRLNTSSIHHYKNHRFPVEIISHAVWLYFRCAPRGAMMS
jgi:hypothetical protein